MIFADTVHVNRGSATPFAVVQLALIVLALVLLRVRSCSVLDLWLQVACFAEFLFQIMSGFIVNERFTVGWYGARFYAVIATFVALIVPAFRGDGALREARPVSRPGARCPRGAAGRHGRDGGRDCSRAQAASDNYWPGWQFSINFFGELRSRGSAWLH